MSYVIGNLTTVYLIWFSFLASDHWVIDIELLLSVLLFPVSIIMSVHWHIKIMNSRWSIPRFFCAIILSNIYIISNNVLSTPENWVFFTGASQHQWKLSIPPTFSIYWSYRWSKAFSIQEIHHFLEPSLSGTTPYRYVMACIPPWLWAVLDGVSIDSHRTSRTRMVNR